MFAWFARRPFGNWGVHAVPHYWRRRSYLSPQRERRQHHSNRNPLSTSIKILFVPLPKHDDNPVFLILCTEKTLPALQQLLEMELVNSTQIMEKTTISVFLIKTKQNLPQIALYLSIKNLYSWKLVLREKVWFLYYNHKLWNQTDPGTNIFT